MKNYFRLKENITNAELVYIFSLGLYLFVRIIDSTQIANLFFWDRFLWIIRFVSVFMVLYSILVGDRIAHKYLIIVISLCAAALGSMIGSSKEVELILTFSFIIGSLNASKDRVLSVYCVTSTIAIIMTLIMYNFRIYDYDSLIWGERVERLYLGFSYTTLLPNYFFHIVCAFVGLQKRKPKPFLLFLLFVVNCIIFIYTDTRIAFLETSLLLFILLLERFKNTVFKNKAIIICFPFICASISLFVSAFYTENIEYMKIINSALSNRLYLGKKAIQLYGFKLFGNPTSWVSGRYGIERFSDYFYVDSSYLNIALTYGVIILLVVLLMFSYMLKESFNHRDNYFFIIAIVFVLIHSITDPQLFEIRYDPFLLCFFPCVLMCEKDQKPKRFIL